MSAESKLQDQVWQAALAGLLHDVGKVLQRARVDPWNPPSDVVSKGQPVHAMWTERFINLLPTKEYREAALPGTYHHDSTKSPATDNHLSTVIELADKLSAGERADAETKEKQPPQQLVTIFDRVALRKGGEPRAKNYLPLQLLALDHAVLFPREATPAQAQGEAYDKLRDALESAAKQNIADPLTYLENMLGAMQRATWCVPSAYYYSVPDVSLYDHARMTAALAACLADWDQTAVSDLLGAVRRDFQNKPLPGDDALMNQDAALLIGGDISGVQDFIYTITAKDAARTLRGRSFYLQLLTEAVLRFVLRELGLPYTNVIYSGGGNFFVLAPVSAQKELPRIQRTVAQKLLAHHGAALYLALGATPVPASGFKRGKFKEHWDAMHLVLGAAKQKRYTELGDELYPRVFEPIAHGGNKEKTCAVCGTESEDVAPIQDDESGGKICALCDSFGDLGSHLTPAQFIALGFSESQDTKRLDATNALRAFGMQFEFATSARDEITFTEKTERAVVWALDDAEKFPTVKDVPTAQLTRYTVKRIPRMTFDELQEKSHGIPRLGVLRMDVDNVGDLFSKGFGEEKEKDKDKDKDKENLATLSRMAALSFQLGLFFEGWVKQICAEQSELIYTVYTGGDDAFLIAPWDIVPNLAQQIAKDLADYCGHNPDVHLSAGMTFIGGKYPLYQAAKDAHDALMQAKALDGKNAFDFLGQAYTWNEFEKVCAKFERLEKLIVEEGAPEAILQTFRQFAQDEARQSKKLKLKPVWGKWMWQGAYKLTRDAKREQNRNPDVAKELLAIRDELSANEYREIGQWGVAARWAQLWLREK